MHQESRWAFTTGSDNFSSSHTFSLSPTSTLAQISMGAYYEFDDKAHADLGFTGCTFLDKDGVTRTDSFVDIDDVNAVMMFGRNKLASATYEIRVSNCYVSAILNFFFWDHVS